MSSPYDAIAELYDPWSASVVEDVGFYLEEARRSGGPVVELGVGTGRIAVPIAADGIRVIGVDSSRAMLEVCARRAALAGVEVDLRVGDLREPPVNERVPLVICPFRSLLHMQTDEDRRLVLASANKLLLPGGRFVFDVLPGAVALVAEGGERLDSIDLQRYPNFVLGSEREGLPDDVLERCEARATIAIAPGVDSLNVAMAGTIVLYERSRKSGV